MGVIKTSAETVGCLGEGGGSFGEVGGAKVGGAEGLAEKASSALDFGIGAVEEREGLGEAGQLSGGECGCCVVLLGKGKDLGLGAVEVNAKGGAQSLDGCN